MRQMTAFGRRLFERIRIPAGTFSLSSLKADFSPRRGMLAIRLRAIFSESQTLNRREIMTSRSRSGLECWLIVRMSADCSTLTDSLVPVVANGFDDLQQRAEGQTKQAQEHHERLKVRLSTVLTNLRLLTFELSIVGTQNQNRSPPTASSDI